MNPDANERNGVFLNQVPQCCAEERTGYSQRNIKICRARQSLRFKQEWRVAPNAETTTQINLEKFAFGVALLDLWRNKAVGFQNTLTAYRVSRPLRSLLTSHFYKHQWQIFPSREMRRLCAAVSIVLGFFSNQASRSFKRLLCQTQPQIYKGKHITWNQIRLMTFCRIHSSLVAWHFEDGARGTQHNK